MSLIVVFMTVFKYNKIYLETFSNVCFFYSNYCKSHAFQIHTLFVHLQ